MDEEAKIGGESVVVKIDWKRSLKIGLLNDVVVQDDSQDDQQQDDQQDDNEVYEAISAQFQTWEPEHLHCVAPSSFTVYSNGDVVATAQHLANMCRTGGILDEGHPWVPTVELTILDDKNTPLVSQVFSMGRLNYKESTDNVVKKWSLPALAPYLEKGTWSDIKRNWVPNYEPLPPVIPITPPIPIG